MKRKILFILLIAAMFIISLPAIAACGGGGGQGSGSDGNNPGTGGDNPSTGGDNPSTGGDNPSTGGDNPSTVNVEYSGHLSIDQTKYPVTVKAGTEVSEYSSITLSMSAWIELYDPNAITGGHGPEAGKGSLLERYQTTITFDVPFTLYQTVKYFETPEDEGGSDRSNWWGGDEARMFELSDYIVSAQIKEQTTDAITAAAQSKLDELNGNYVINKVSADSGAGAGPEGNLPSAMLSSLFNVVETDVAVERVIDGGTVAPYNMAYSWDWSFKSVNDNLVNLNTQMIEAAYAPGEITTAPGDYPDSFNLLIDRKQFKARCNYGGIPYDITLNFTINNDYSTSVDFSVYSSGVFEDDEFIMSQFNDLRESTVTFTVQGNVDGTIKSYPLNFDRNDIEGYEFEYGEWYESDWLIVNLKEEKVFGLFAASSLRIEIIEPDHYIFNVKDVSVAEYEQLLNAEILTGLTLEYTDGHTIPYGIDKAGVDDIYIGAMNNYINSVNFADMKASDTPFEYYSNYDENGKLVQCEVIGILKESVAYAIFEDSIEKEQQIYKFQAFTPPQIENVIEIYYHSVIDYTSRSPQSRTAPLPEDFFAGIQTDKKGVYVCTPATEDMLNPEMCDSFTLTVLADTITNLTFELDPLFDGIVVDEPINLSNCFTVAHYSHGQTWRVPLTVDMLGGYDPTSTSRQAIPVTFDDGDESCTNNVTMWVRKVKSFSVYSGLDDYYLKDEEPDFDVWLSVTYSDDSKDYVSVPSERFQSLDTSRAGSGSITFTYGGVTKTHGYNVIEGLYLTYTKNESITFTNYLTGKPDADAENVYVPGDIKNIVLPADIGGVPVTALSANLFANLSILKSLVVPDSVTSIGYGVVDNCKNLQKLTIPGSIALEKYFKQYKAPASWLDSPVYPKPPQNLTVVISDTASDLCDNFLSGLVFEDRDYTFKIDFGAGLTSLDNQSYDNWGYISEFSATGNTSILVKENVVFTQGGAILWYYPNCKTETTYYVEDGVTAIGYMSNKNIVKLTVAASVETLPDSFMSVCSLLQSVVFEAGSNVKDLPNASFSSCEGLTEFVFPDKLQTIGVNALTYINVSPIAMPKTVTTIGRGAFNEAKCSRFYLPSGATRSCVDSDYLNPLQPVNLPNLVDFAYDGSVQPSSLSFFLDSFSRHMFTNMYITGEKSDITGSEWYDYRAVTFIKSVHVYGGVNFDRRTLGNNVTVTLHPDTSGQWW